MLDRRSADSVVRVVSHVGSAGSGTFKIAAEEARANRSSATGGDDSAGMFGVGILKAMIDHGVEGTELLSFGVMLLTVMLFVAFSALVMAIWLAPPLVIFHEISAFRAIKSSLGVAVRNILPFSVYTLLVLIAAVLASLPLLLGWLVLLPVLYASLYAAYRDLFFAE